MLCEMAVIQKDEVGTNLGPGGRFSLIEEPISEVWPKLDSGSHALIATTLEPTEKVTSGTKPNTWRSELDLLPGQSPTVDMHKFSTLVDHDNRRVP